MDPRELVAAMRRLVEDTAEYKALLEARRELSADPQMEAQVDRLREDNYRLQQSEEAFHLEAVEAFAAQHDALLHHPAVQAYLQAETVFSRLMRDVLDQVAQELAL